MSKIEVDAIDKQSGSTLTLGGSGTAVTLACGATQSGFGRTGTVDWVTDSIKTATFTAESGKGYFCNTAGGAFEMDLPAGSAGAIVSVQDYNNTFDSNQLEVDPNGSEKINGGGAGDSVKLTTEGQGVTFVYIDATVGWRTVSGSDDPFAQPGTNQQFVAATGGTITTVCTNFKVHTFTGPGTFTVTCAGNACGSNTVSYMVVAGGGGGGGGCGHGGGGGAGGFRESKAATDSYTASPLNATSGPTYNLPVTATGFPITVGAGGGGAAGNPGTPGTSGGVSTFSTITSAGGGGGQTPGGVGLDGGSGGGAGGPDPSSNKRGDGNTPPVSPPQGNNGGPSSYNTPNYGAGGGGGAGAAGTAGTTTAGGPGGNGVATSINGAPVTRAGGGGGSSYQGGGPNAGGAGGGGTGTIGGPAPNSANATVGTVNTGGGGGGGESGVPSSGGKNGGSGIVIIRYKFQ